MEKDNSDYKTLEFLHDQLERHFELEVSERMKSQRKFEYIFNRASDAFFIINLDGEMLNFSDTNSRASELLGYTKEEFKNLSLLSILKDEDDLERVKEWIRDQKKHNIEIVFISKNQNRVNVEIGFEIFKIDNKNSLFLIARDIRERLILAEQERILVQQSKMASMGELIGVVAHQWKQPLSSLSMLLVDLEDRVLCKEELSEDMLLRFVEKSLSQVEFMDTTINDFRNFFKPTREKRYFRVKNPIIEILNLLSLQLEKAKIEYTLSDNSSEETLVYGYDNEFKQVILNLVNNSKDSIIEKSKEPFRDGGKIDILISEDEEYLKVEISDDGIGVKKDEVEHIFEPYVSTKGENGTGIGLWMSRKIIEDSMDGTLKCLKKDSGATFVMEMKKTDT